MRTLEAVAIGLLLSGCISNSVSELEVYDPGEGFNRTMFALGEVLDKRIMIPVAKGYKKVTPDAVERGVANFFANIRNIDSALNGFLQGKLTTGATDMGRVVVNSTLGVAGIFDVATRIGLEHGHEDLGQTLAVWGVKKTRFVYIPLLGPTSLRELPGVIVDLLVPIRVLGKGYSLGVGSLDVIHRRAEALRASTIRDDSALDPYVFTRTAYFQRRQYLIYDGEPPVEDFDDTLFDDLDSETLD